MAKEKIDYCRLAPTWLYKGAETKLFSTQEQVDAAWDDGWHGSGFTPDLPTEDLISGREFEKKADILEAVEKDSRYVGLELTMLMTLKDIAKALLDFEEENKL